MTRDELIAAVPVHWHGGWLIDWTPIKTGRKVTALKFVFKRDPQGQLPL